ncbi:MAG: heme exporter protein CcmB, partial [Candidatus Marinimicrobia bacterium]|nr:heme exporter protein CcmB [Candidatus Neomarinimicrobiota bacterium]
FTKVFSHWLVTGVPILIACLTSSLFLFMSKDTLIALFLSLFLGSLSLSLLGALGGALSLGKSAILSAVIVLPLSIPILLLGSATLSAAIGSYDYSVYLYYMGAILAVAIPGLSLATVEAVLLNYE